MKHILLLLTAFSAAPAFAVNNAKVDLVCWDAKSAFGSKPVMALTAHYNRQNPEGATISDVTFPSDDADYEYLPRAIREIFQGEEVTTSRSPYVGNYSYDLQDGIRLVLVKDVSPSTLKEADVDGRGRGHAAILDVASKVHKKWSGGSFYIRMRCREAR
jgi:hypothetical protein